MSRVKQTTFAAAAVLCAIVLFVAGLLVGKALPDEERIYFYADILSIKELDGKTEYHVRGIEENDINHRSEFYVYSYKNTIYKNVFGEKANPDILRAGSQVRIGYTGFVLTVYPGIIYDIREITLIE